MRCRVAPLGRDRNQGRSLASRDGNSSGPLCTTDTFTMEMECKSEGSEAIRGHMDFHHRHSLPQSNNTFDSDAAPKQRLSAAA